LAWNCRIIRSTVWYTFLMQDMSYSVVNFINQFPYSVCIMNYVSQYIAVYYMLYYATLNQVYIYKYIYIYVLFAGQTAPQILTKYSGGSRIWMRGVTDSLGRGVLESSPQFFWKCRSQQKAFEALLSTCTTFILTTIISILLRSFIKTIVCHLTTVHTLFLHCFGTA
jgi:hypothetical protein